MNIILFTLLTFYYELGYATGDEKKLIDNCYKLENGNCLSCDQKYFLFSLPQDHTELGFKAGARICVECPYQKFNETNNYYCGDCLDNSQLWDKSRICSYDYKTKSTGTSVFHKIERPVMQLFYVIKSGLTTFTTQSCDGCEHFCKSQNSTCFPVQKYYAYDLNKLQDQICAEGYEYSDSVGGCDPCPDNCKSCKITSYKTIDISGKTIIETKKNCLICNQGFSILTTRTMIGESETTSQCIACFMGCETCYFGKNLINLNEKPWDTYNNNILLVTDNFKANETKFYEDLFRLVQIAQRCEYCIVRKYQIEIRKIINGQLIEQYKYNGLNIEYDYTAQSMINNIYQFYTFIPSLNRRTCIRCGTNCRRCEYTSEIEYPTRDTSVVVEPNIPEPTTADIDTVESKYLLRCRECDKFNQTFLAVGTGCADCSITKCQLCAKFDPSSGNDISTISPNFKPLQDETKSVEKCLLCTDGYFLSDDQKLCTIIDQTNKPIGCLTYQKLMSTQNKCLKCDIGYTLYKNELDIWVCKMDQSLKSDYLCKSFIQIGTQARCQQCLDGFYVDMKTGYCKKCSENGHCKSCYSLSLFSVHHPEYLDYQLDGEENAIFGPYCIECNRGDQFKGPFLNEDLRYCEKGGDKCALFQAVGQKGYCDQCDRDPDNEWDISLSSSDDGYNCIACPEYTIGCRERSQQEIALINKYYDPIGEIDTKYSRLAFKCEENEIYFDSKIGRCISLKDCPKGCDLSDQITINANCIQRQININLTINNQLKIQ